MERTEKKCLIASAASHGLLLGTLLIGSAFISKPPPADDVVPIDMISSTTVDGILSGGGGGGRSTPAPTPRVVPTPVQPQVRPTQPVVPPTQPVRQPQVSPKPVVEQPTPPRTTAKAPKDDSPKLPIKPDGIEKSGKRESPFKPTVRQPKTSKKNKSGADEDNGAQQQAAKKAHQKLADDANRIVAGLSTHLAASGGLTASDMPGTGGGAAAINYLQTVLGAYDAAWDPPREIEEDDSIVTVRVKVARSGTILSASISKRSGIPALDQSVQRALERVRSLNPFPPETKDLERNFKIDFNLKAKRARA